MAGFVAATYRRGAPFVQCPTTLRAMVDAAVGGKTGVNLILKREAAPALLLKNMIGAFYQPSLVLADVSVLRTLPERQFRSGLAECIKHGLLSADFDDPGLLDWIEANAAAILARDERVLVELIARNVAVKAAVVAADERELAGEGGRALLNLGHTFAHALEALGAIDADGHQQPTQAEGGEQNVPRGTSVPSAHLEGEQGHPGGGPEPLLHGEAVGLGILCAVRLAESLGRPIGGLRDRIAALLEEFGLPTSLPSLPDMDVVLERMGHDKKARGGSLRFVVPEGAGRCAMVAVSDRNTIAGAVKSLVSGGR
jgi:3-dehydroquinate synthase